MKTRMKNVMLGAMSVILLTTGIGYGDLSAGLVGYWSFDNAADPGHDNSGNGHHGDVEGDTTLTENRFGESDKACYFDGDNDFINLGSDPALSPNTFSVSAWFKTSLVDPTWHTIYGLAFGAGSWPDFDIRIWHTSVLTLKVRDQKLHGVTPVADGKWHHVVAMREGSLGRIFLDGGLEAESGSMSGSVINNRPLPYYIGGVYEWDAPASYDFEGCIDEVRLYNRALSEIEIQELAGTAEPTPAEQIQEILDFVDDSVIAGTLVGDGPGKSADNRLNALINMLEEVQSLIEAELFSEACLQLQDAYKKCDGQSPPPDFATGSAAVELAEKIENLMENLSCPPSLDLGFMDNFVDTWPDTYSQNGIWKKCGPKLIKQNNTYLRPENVSVSDGKLILTVPANKYEAGQIESVSHDFHYGYYEARIKASAEPGVVNAFFMWSPNANKNEIDIEFLSNEFGINTGQVHFVLHPFYEGQPHDAIVDLPFNPSANFHDYGFAWSASSVDFFVDSQPVATMSASDGFPVPLRPGAIMLSNWTGGLINWGGGPPSNSTAMEVDWVSFTPESD